MLGNRWSMWMNMDYIYIMYMNPDYGIEHVGSIWFIYSLTLVNH